MSHYSFDPLPAQSLIVLIRFFQRENFDPTLESSPTGERPWFFRHGKRRPLPAVTSRKTGKRQARLWPHEAPHEDRIINQLMYVPPAQEPPQQKLKKILFYYGLSSWNLRPGREAFLNAKCPVDTCTITSSATEAPTVDAILYKDRFVHPGHVRPPRQVRG